MMRVLVQSSSLGRWLRLDPPYHIGVAQAAEILGDLHSRFRRLDDLASSISDGSRLPETNEVHSIPIVRSSDVRIGELYLRNLGRVPADKIRSVHLTKPGDVLLTKTANEFRAAEIRKLDEPLAYAADVIRIRPRPGIAPGFLAAVLNSDRYARILETRSYGTAVRRFRVADLREIPVPLPSRSVQMRIAERLSEAQNRADAAEKELDALRAAIDAEVEARGGVLPGVSFFEAYRSDLSERWNVSRVRWERWCREQVDNRLLRPLGELAQPGRSSRRGIEPDGEVLAVQLSDIDLTFGIIEGGYRSRLRDLSDRIRQPLHPNQVLLGNVGDTIGTPRQIVAVAEPEVFEASSNLPVLATTALTTLTFHETPRYYALVLRHPMVLAQMALLAGGSMQLFLNKRDLDRLLIPVLGEVWREDFEVRMARVLARRREAIQLRLKAIEEVEDFLTSQRSI